MSHQNALLTHIHWACLMEKSCTCTCVWRYMSHLQEAIAEELSWSELIWLPLEVFILYFATVHLCLLSGECLRCCTPKGLILFSSRKYCNTSVWIVVFSCFVLRFIMNLWARKHKLCKVEQIILNISERMSEECYQSSSVCLWARHCHFGHWSYCFIIIILI